MNTSKVKVISSTILGKICSILGYGLCGFLLLGFLGMMLSGDSTPSIIFMFVWFFGISGMLIYSGISTKRTIKRFKEYVHIISSNINTLDNIAANVNQSENFVTKDLEKMISKGYFADAYVDRRLGQIIIGQAPTSSQAKSPSSTESVTPSNQSNVECKGCGAVGNQDFCEYCGSPLR